MILQNFRACKMAAFVCPASNGTNGNSKPDPKALQDCCRCIPCCIVNPPKKKGKDKKNALSSLKEILCQLEKELQEPEVTCTPCFPGCVPNCAVCCPPGGSPPENVVSPPQCMVCPPCCSPCCSPCCPPCCMPCSPCCPPCCPPPADPPKAASNDQSGPCCIPMSCCMPPGCCLPSCCVTDDGNGGVVCEPPNVMVS